MCSVSVLYIWLCFPRLCILASEVFQFSIFYFAIIASVYYHLHYFCSLYFTLLSLYVHLSICSVSVLYILLCVPRFYILTSAVFQCCILYFTFLVSESSHLPYFSSVSFTLLSSSADIYICSISVLYFTLLASCLHIDIFSISIVYILICFSRL